MSKADSLEFDPRKALRETNPGIGEGALEVTYRRKNELRGAVVDLQEWARARGFRRAPESIEPQPAVNPMNNVVDLDERRQLQADARGQIEAAPDQEYSADIVQFPAQAEPAADPFMDNVMDTVTRFNANR